MVQRSAKKKSVEKIIIEKNKLLIKMGVMYEFKS